MDIYINIFGLVLPLFPVYLIGALSLLGIWLGAIAYDNKGDNR